MDADDIDLIGDFLRQSLPFDELYDLSWPGDDGAPDGVVDISDMDYLVHALVETTVGVGSEYGDFNLDGVIDTTDQTRLATNFGPGSTWAEGNANRHIDLTIDTTDLTILGTYFGFAATPAGDVIGGPTGAELAALAEIPVPPPAEDEPLGAPLSLSPAVSFGPELDARIEPADVATPSSPATTKLVESVDITGEDLSLGGTVRRGAHVGSPDTEVNLLAAWPTWRQGVGVEHRQTAPPVMTGERSGRARPLTLPRRLANSGQLSMNLQAAADTDMQVPPTGRPCVARPASIPSDLQTDLVNILDETELLATL